MTADITSRIAAVLLRELPSFGWRDADRKHIATAAAEVLTKELAPDIDVVAQSVYLAVRPNHHLEWTDIGEPSRNVYRRMARGAVAAMGWVRDDNKESR